MLTIEKTVLPSPEQWMIAIEGMRNPHNSWTNIDSYITHIEDSETLETASFEFFMGEKDYKRAMSLSNAGSVEAKYRRMLPVWVTINAPLYWWKEFETYRVGIAPNPTDIEWNSCSTMHKIHEKEFTIEDFSTEHMALSTLDSLKNDIWQLNKARHIYVDWDTVTEDDIFQYLGECVVDRKTVWYQMIQLLPTSYNQKRTVMLNYESLSNIYKYRRYHKLDEWVDFCKWIEGLPYSKLITSIELWDVK